MSFLTAASDKSSNGNGVSGVSGASFSGVSGLTSSFSFTAAVVFVLLAINFSSVPLPQGNAHANSQVPYPMQRVHVPMSHVSPNEPVIELGHESDSPAPPWLPGTYLITSTRTATATCGSSTHVTIRICDGPHMSRRAVPAPGHCPEPRSNRIAFPLSRSG